MIKNVTREQMLQFLLDERTGESLWTLDLVAAFKTKFWTFTDQELLKVALYLTQPDDEQP